MKNFLLLVLSIISMNVYAEINKCVIGGKQIFQGAPCPAGTQQKFELTPDISYEKQQAASEKLEADMKRWKEEKQLKKAAEDEERKIQAAEDLARNVGRRETETVYEKANDGRVGVRYGVDYPIRKRPIIKNKLKKKLK
ncbi:MAG: hypothetical protein PSN04_10575 [Methyloprofundus sp.]|nr:hypothetical protein [Methyloprofundus sp.]